MQHRDDPLLRADRAGAPARRQGGRNRRYEGDDVARLRFIRRARQLGFTLDEVRTLRRLAASDGEGARAEVRGLAAAHVAEIETTIADLQAMARVLKVAICAGDTQQRPRCPLIEVYRAVFQLKLLLDTSQCETRQEYKR